MASGDDVQLLVEFGLINEEGVSRLAGMIRGVQALTGGGTAPARGPGRQRGRPRKAEGKAAPPAGAKKRGGKRTPFSATKEELQALRKTMTVKQIAQKYGVSTPTIFLKLKKFGLTTPRKGAKKK